MSWLDRLRLPLASKETAATKLAEAVAGAETAVQTARGLLATLEAQRADHATDERRRLDFNAKVTAAEGEIADAEAMLERLRERRDTAISTEAEQRRRATFDQAQTAAATFKKALRKRYPEGARIFLELLELAAEAENLRALANAHLPSGENPIPDPEAEVRDQAAVQARVVKTRREERWLPEGQGEPLNSSATITETKPGYGVWDGPQGLRKVRKATFRVSTLHTYQPAASGERLCTLSIPGLVAGEPAWWTPTAWNLWNGWNRLEVANAKARRAEWEARAATRATAHESETWTLENAPPLEVAD